MKSRQALITISALVLIIIITGFMGLRLSGARQHLKATRSTLAALDENKDAVMDMNLYIKSLERKRNITSVEGIAQAMEDVLGSLTLKDKLTSLKPVPSRDPEDDRAELTFEGLDVNEMTNIIYSVRNAPMLLIIRKAGISTSFLKPSLVDMSLTVSLIKPETNKK
jgi:hypothetical protein